MRPRSVVVLLLAALCLGDSSIDGPSVLHPWLSFLVPMRREDVTEPTRKGLAILGTEVEAILYFYVFPVQFILGTVGNCINLVVLLSRTMRTEANQLLAAMALADIGVFISQLLFAICVYEPLYKSNSFRALHFTFRQNVNAVCNFFSACTCWFVLAVSLERYLGIRTPLRQRVGHERRTYLTIVGIVAASFIVTAFHHFEYETGFYWNHNHTLVQPIINHIVSLAKNKQHNFVDDHIQLKATFVDVGKSVSIISVIFVPQLFIIFFNISIIKILRQNNAAFHQSVSNGDNQAFHRQQNERRLTITVVAIITCYSITTLPSAIPFVLELIFKYIYNTNVVMEKKFRWLYYYALPVLTSWTLTGKVMNFVLFCMSSKHYRRRLCDIFFRKWSRYGIYRPAPATRLSSLEEPSAPLRRQISDDDRQEPEYELTAV